MGFIGVLSTLDNPQLAGYLANLKHNKLTDYAVVCDSKHLSANQKHLFSDRLGGWNISEHYNFHIYRDAPRSPFYFVDSHNSSSCLELIQRLGCSFLLNAGTPRKLSEHILNSTAGGVLNIHPGSLPSYRGKNCPEWAVFNGDKVIISAHIMDAEYDEGNVLGTLEVDWRQIKNYISFRQQVYLKSFELAAKVSSELIQGTSTVLFNSKNSQGKSVVHDAMPDEFLQIVKNRFREFHKSGSDE